MSDKRKHSPPVGSQQEGGVTAPPVGGSNTEDRSSCLRPRKRGHPHGWKRMAHLPSGVQPTSIQQPIMSSVSAPVPATNVTHVQQPSKLGGDANATSAGGSSAAGILCRRTENESAK